MKVGVRGLLLSSIVFLILLTSFILASHVVTTNTGATEFIVNEDVGNNYTIRVANTDTGSATNITQVNITIPSSFTFITGSNLTNATNIKFANSSTILNWTNSSYSFINISESKFFSFNATASTPGNYNFTVSTKNSTGVYTTNISVTVNDTTVPSSVILVSPTYNNNTNFSRSYIPVNVTSTDNGNINSTRITLYNSTKELVSSSLNFSSQGRYLSNFTSLSDGVYYANVTVNDTFGNSNSSITRMITLDTLAPNVVEFNNVSNSANLSRIKILNTTVNDTTLSVSYVRFNVSNSTGQVRILNASNPANDFWNVSFNTSKLADGNYNITVISNDTLGNLNNSERVLIIIDNTYPNVSSTAITNALSNSTAYFISPQDNEGTYDNVSIDLSYSESVTANITVLNRTGSVVRYLYSSSSVSNPSAKIWNGTNDTYSLVSDGKYIINSTLVDVGNNENRSEILIVYVDNTKPVFSSHTKDTTPNRSQSVQLNVTITEINVDNVILEFNNTNYTVTTNSSGEFYYTIGSGNYSAHQVMNYTWFANDTIGNSNISSIQTFTVANVAPTLNGTISNFTFTENGATQTLNLSFYFNDSDNDTLTFGPTSLQNFSTYSITNNVLTFAPTYGYNGTTVVNFFANDSYNTTNSNLVTLTVTAINHAPRYNVIPNITFTEDNYNDSINLSSYFFDDDGTISSFNKTTEFNTTNLTITISNNIVNVTSDSNWNGNASLYFTAKDNDDSIGTSNKVWIKISAVNDVPVINISNITLAENSSAIILNISNYTTDVESNPENFTYYTVTGNASRIACSVSGVNLTYTPVTNWFGVTHCNLTANDGTGNSTVFQLNFNITNVNDDPNITSTAVTTGTEDSLYSYTVNVSDADNNVTAGTDTITFSLTTLPSGMVINNATGAISWVPTNSNTGLNNVTVLVIDNSGGNDTQTFQINVTNTNDLPSITSLHDPTNASKIYTSSKLLRWNASTDPDNDTMTYYVYFSNTTSPGILTNTTELNLTVTNLNHSNVYYWYVVAGDSTGNITKSSTYQFNVSLKTAPAINAFFPTSLTPSLEESAYQKFNVSANDSDSGDTLTYSWKLNNSVVSTTAVYNFTTNYTSKGTYNLSVVVKDSFNLTTLKEWKISVDDNNVPTISSSSPTDTTPTIQTNSSQAFSVTVSDPESDTLTYLWRLDSVAVTETSSAHTFVLNVSKSYNVSVRIKDISNNTISKEWTLTVTSVPVAETFASNSETTNLSKVSNISAVQNYKVANTKGTIDFGSNTLNLKNVLDIDSAIKIVDGVVAINSSKYSQLNKSATITLKGLTYTSIPTIFFNNGFTTTSSAITTECTFCNVTNYTSAPTTDGQVTFTVDHFSSFKVSGSGVTLDLSSYDDLDLCDEGIKGNLDIEINDPDEGDNFEIGDTIDIKVDVKNNADEDKDIVVEAALYNIDEDDEVESEESNDEEVNEGDSETFKLEIDVPEDFEDGDNYAIFVKAYEDSEEDTQCNQGLIEIDLEREKHKVIIKEVSISPQVVYSGNNLNIFVDLQNVGTSDEDVYVVLENTLLEISETSETFELEEFDQDDDSTQIFFVEIPSNAKAGEYQFIISTWFDGEVTDTTRTITVLEGLNLVAGSQKQIIDINQKEETTSSISLGKKSTTKSVSNILEEEYSLVLILAIAIVFLLLVMIIVLILKRRI